MAPPGAGVRLPGVAVGGSLAVTLSAAALLLLAGCARSPILEDDPPGDLVCPGILALCDDVCVDLDSDPGNCGRCDDRCGSGAFCVDGACEDACPLAVCGDRCVDLASSPLQCGDCETACEDTGYCEGGVCSDRCPEPLLRCGARCVDPIVDPNNCGGCGATCGDDRVCGGGACLVACPSGSASCGGSCVDLGSSPNHCGGCGNACATSAACRSGACIPIRELTDADGDTIVDLDEGGAQTPPTDTDGDGIPDFQDADTDGDGIADRVEAGDDDPVTPPRDSDRDGIPDFRDLDSDGDGLTDRREAERGCLDPTRADSDGDGQSDLAEEAAGTDPCDPDSRIPEFFFILPLNAPSGESAATLTFDTTIRKADVHFNVDTTGSMNGEIENLQSSLTSVVIPGIGLRIPDAAFGVSEFEDFPFGTFGSARCSSGEPDMPHKLIQQVTTDVGLVEAGLQRLNDPIGCGNDFPEAGFESLYQVATGEGVSWPGGRVEPVVLDSTVPGAGDRGGAGFRQGSFPVIVHVTDQRSHLKSDYVDGGIPEAHGEEDAIAAMDAIGARIIGIASEVIARDQLEVLALNTGGFVPPSDAGECETGIDGATREPASFEGAFVCPLVFDALATGDGLSETLVAGVVDLVTALQFDTVSVRVVDDEFGFIKATIPRSASTPEGSAAPTVRDLDGDTVFDAFVGVTPGTLVTFTVLAFNDTLPESTISDQVFTLRLQVVGDEVAVLDEQLVVIVVPKAEE